MVTESVVDGDGVV